MPALSGRELAGSHYRLGDRGYSVFDTAAEDGLVEVCSPGSVRTVKARTGSADSAMHCRVFRWGIGHLREANPLEK